MKSIKLALVLSFAVGSIASAQQFSGQCGGRGRNSNGGCNEPTAYTCYTVDAYGNTFSAYNAWDSNAVVPAYDAIKKCRAESPAPRTCRPAGCTPNN